MSTNEVFIKDLPYEFLKKSGESLIASQQFADHAALFDANKKPYANLVTLPDSKNVPDKVIYYLKKMIFGKYINDPTLPVADESQALMTWYYLQAKVKLNNKFKKNNVKINKINKELSSYTEEVKPTLLTRIVDTSFILNSTNVYDSTINPIEGLRPASTGNAVLDVINSAKYYGNGIDAYRFDDVLAKIVKSSLMKSRSDIVPVFSSFKEEINKGINSKQEDGVKRVIDVDILSVKGLLKDKLVSTTYDASLSPIDKNSIKRSMLFALPKTFSDKYSIERYESYGLSSPLSSYTFQTSSLQGNLKAFALTQDGYAVQCSAGITGEAAVTFINPTNCVILSISDTEDISVPSLKTLYSTKTSLTIRKFVMGELTSWKIPLSSAFDGFIYEAYGYDGTHLEPLSVTYTKDLVQINFSLLTTGTVYLLGASDNGIGRSKLTISDSTVINMLPSIDLENDRYQLWT